MNKKEKYSPFFVALVAIYITVLLISNIAAFKLINFWGVVLTGGTIVFPITYILSDVFAEVYGYDKTKKITFLGFFCCGFAVLVFQLLIKLPYPDHFLYQKEFATVLSTTLRIFIAGLTAFLLGQLANAYILNYIKNKSKIKYLWFRTIASTIIGELIDTTIFLTIAFIGVLNYQILLFMLLCQTLVKVGYEIILTPLLYKAVAFAKKQEDIIHE